MQLTLNIENQNVYNTLVPFLKSIGITIDGKQTVEVHSKKKLSALKGRVTKMSAEEIDKQIKSLRDEWQRDI